MASGQTNIWLGTTDTDYGTATNWSLGTVPVEGEDVVIPAEATRAIAASNQSAVPLVSFIIEDGYGEDIGDADSFLQVSITDDSPAATKVDLAPTGTIVSLDLGATAVPVTIRNSGTPAAGEHALQIKGTAMTTIKVLKGIVGIGVEANDTTTDFDDLFVSYKTEAGLTNDAQVTIGAGVTGETADAFVSIRQTGGIIHNHSDETVALLDVTDGEYHQTAGLWTTARFAGAAKVFPSDLGTCVTTKLFDTANVTHLGLVAIAYTNVVLYEGTTWIDKQLRNTYGAGKIEIPGGLDSVNLDLGPNIDIVATAS